MKGTTCLWLPVPDLDTDWQQTVDTTWTGNATRCAWLARDTKKGVGLFVAEFAPAVAAAGAERHQPVRTRNRCGRLEAGRAGEEDPAVLRAALEPTELLPLDGIVAETALPRSPRARRPTSTGARDLRLGGRQRPPRAQERAAAAPATSRPCWRPATWAASAPT